MSDATHGGDATSTGREGLQQVRLAKSLPKKLGGSSACHSGRPAFCDNHSSPPSIADHTSAGRSFVFDRFGLRYPSALRGLRFGPASWKCATAGVVIHAVQFFAG